MRTKERQVTTIWLPPTLARSAEKVAEQEGRTKSELIREALRQYIWLNRWSRLRRYGTAKARDIGLKQEDIDTIIHEQRRAKKTARGR